MRMWNIASIPFVGQSSVEIVRHSCKRPAFGLLHIQYPNSRFRLEHIAHFVRDKLMDFHRPLQQTEKLISLVIRPFHTKKVQVMSEN